MRCLSVEGTGGRLRLFWPCAAIGGAVGALPYGMSYRTPGDFAIRPRTIVFRE